MKMVDKMSFKQNILVVSVWTAWTECERLIDTDNTQSCAGERTRSRQNCKNTRIAQKF